MPLTDLFSQALSHSPSTAPLWMFRVWRTCHECQTQTSLASAPSRPLMTAAVSCAAQVRRKDLFIFVISQYHFFSSGVHRSKLPFAAKLRAHWRNDIMCMLCTYHIHFDIHTWSHALPLEFIVLFGAVIVQQRAHGIGMCEREKHNLSQHLYVHTLMSLSCVHTTKHISIQ